MVIPQLQNVRCKDEFYLVGKTDKVFPVPKLRWVPYSIERGHNSLEYGSVKIFQRA